MVDPAAQSVCLLAARKAGEMRIVFVDDCKDLADVMVVLCKQLVKCEGIAAYSGPEALSLVREFRPHIAFIDLVMPKMSGMDVAKQIRSEALPIKLVAFTGMSTASVKMEAREAGFDSFLLKPASMRIIVDTLEQVPAH